MGDSERNEIRRKSLRQIMTAALIALVVVIIIGLGVIALLSNVLSNALRDLH
jgi:hypothetical protein